MMMAQRTFWKNAVSSCILVCSLTGTGLPAQSTHEDAKVISGDAPIDAGPLAADVSPALTPEAVKAAMRKVGDWQSARIAETPGRSEWFGALYLGLLAASTTLDEPHYRDVVLNAAQHFNWELGLPKKTSADSQTIGQVYLQLNQLKPDPQHLESMRAQFEGLLQTTDDPAKPVWWYCDALFMAPPTWAGLAAETHDSRYLDYLNREWQATDRLLWDPETHLFVRDASYLGKRDKNGSKVFWSRGNGWDMAGLVDLLNQIPAKDPHRTFYIKRLQQMSASLARLQGKDGLWRSSLLDAADYPAPEVSGSAFYIYAMAWGLNHKLLKAKVYGPIVERGWAGLTKQIYADGRLGNVQPGGSGPAVYPAGSSWIFGTGAFLLAGSEVAQWAERSTSTKR